MSKAISYHSLLAVFVLLVFNLSTASAQTTEFTYQGKLTDGDAAADCRTKEIRLSAKPASRCLQIVINVIGGGWTAFVKAENEA